MSQYAILKTENSSIGERIATLNAHDRISPSNKNRVESIQELIELSLDRRQLKQAICVPVTN
jgi:hypothetical protein